MKPLLPLVVNLAQDVFPLCDKKNVMNQGEPRQEKVSTVMSFPGVLNFASEIADDDWTTRGSCYGTSTKVGDGYNTIGDVRRANGWNETGQQGIFCNWSNGNQIRWSLDFYNWYNNGTDVWH